MDKSSTSILGTLSPSSISEPILIDTPDTFLQMMAHLEQQQVIAMDTESNSLYRYYPKVCLIQITTYADPNQLDPTLVVDYLVDSLHLECLNPLNRLTANPNVEIILHSASNDILTLQRDFHFTFNRIYDTQLAARILGWRQIGLASMLKAHFGVISDKSMQRTNWGQRPLSQKQIAYAQMDTHYLLSLRQLQIQELLRVRRWEEAQEAFAALSKIDYQERSTASRSFWQMKAARTIDRKDTGILEALWLWRENEAQRQDRPPFKVVGDQCLVEMAVKKPTNQYHMQRIPGLSDYQIKRYGKALLHTIHRGKNRPLPKMPEQKFRPEMMLEKPVLARFDSLRQWRSKVSQERGVDPDIIFNNDTLLSIARAFPQTESDLRKISTIGPWKAQNYGPEILALLKP